MANPSAGFIGIAHLQATTGVLADLYLRCSDMNITPTQKALYYDHVIGLRDTIPSNSDTKGEITNSSLAINTQKKFWRASTIKYSGSLTYPAIVYDDCSGCQTNTLQKVFDIAKYGTYFNITLYYNCDNDNGNLKGRKFTDCRIDNYSFTSTVGDVITINIEVVASDVVDTQMSVSDAIYSNIERFITWETMNLTVSGGGGVSAPVDPGFSIPSDLIQSFDFNVANNINIIYTQEKLKPKDLRVGMQEVTGSLVLYNKKGTNIMPYDTLISPFYINVQTVCSFDETIRCVFEPSSIPGSTTTILSTIPFSGVDKALGA